MSAIDSALSDIRNGHVGQIPNHLKDGHYQGAKDQADLLVTNIHTNMLMAMFHSNIYLINLKQNLL